MGRREANKQRKREALEGEGLRLFLEAGYDRTSIELIAQAAGVARGTFYLYFPDKLALFETLMQRWFEPVLGVLADVERKLQETASKAEALATYEQMGMGLAIVALANQQEILLAFRENRRTGEAGDRLRERELAIVEKVTRLTELAVERGLIRVGNARLVTLIIVGAVERLYYEALVGGELGADVETVAREVVRLFASTMDLPVATGEATGG